MLHHFGGSRGASEWSRTGGRRMRELPVEVEALRKIPFFEELTSEDLDRIAKIGERRSFAPGDPIMTRADVGSGLFVIFSGTAVVETGGKAHTLGPGDFFGEMALIAGRKRTATVKALDRVDTLRIGAEEFQGFLVQQPQVALAILKSLVERLREVQERLDAWAGLG